MITFSNLSIEPEEIVDFLKREVLYKEVCQKIIYQKIIAQAAIERGITVTAEEIQAEADNMRWANRLKKPSDTIIWLTEQMITVDDWEAGIHDRLLAQKLAEFLFAKKVDKFFAQNRSIFDQFVLYQIVVPYEQVAREILYHIDEEEISFYEAAHLYDIDERRRYLCGYEGKHSLGSLPLEIATVVFRAPVGEVLGPIQTEQGYHLLMVEGYVPDEFTPERRQDILELLFKDWLASELNYRIRSHLMLGKHEFATDDNRLAS
ncbi:peptidylprolyl isomerase [Hydrococcus rivularis NIES-593]|uniref:peptidylprolyl isomerase n=1 Tax=Hydrococcus rivularis NIES-593 TaxID=1921803 RepID=A0A1U7HC98_9CYAN|nr:peptidylprolyl isomerase [Hydrococcus rivularis]OKH21206.1 peptidylprolyl isomerase [Hydrococcus rivularis NIES-593]